MSQPHARPPWPKCAGKRKNPAATASSSSSDAAEAEASFSRSKKKRPGVLRVFRQFALAELRAATKGFSADLIVSESGEKAPNVVYKAKLAGGSLVAVKHFSRQSWPDAQQFVEEATGVGKVQHRRLVNLIGCCSEGDERLLVVEFMPKYG